LELKSPKSTEDLKNLKKNSWVGTPLFLFSFAPLGKSYIVFSLLAAVTIPPRKKSQKVVINNLL
jgi:hypothetical protein